MRHYKEAGGCYFRARIPRVLQCRMATLLIMCPAYMRDLATAWQALAIFKEVGDHS